MAQKDEFVEYLLELLHNVGPVTSKRMFGGYGLYLDSTMFALVADETLYFKTGENNISDYLDQTLPAFTYSRNNKTIALSYNEAPAEVFDDPEVMSYWANNAIGAALLSKNKKLKSN